MIFNKQPKTNLLFSNKALVKLIIPLIIETFLGTTIGFVGTIMVASAGEAAVSAVSLVDNINVFILGFLAALATGGAIIIAQNLGKGDRAAAGNTAKQLLVTNLLLSLFFMTISLTGNKFLLSLIFGAIEYDVMQLAQTYFLITVISYPFTAIMSSISAIFRAMGISKTPMLVTLAMSVINMSLCAILIYGFDMGVQGAAIAALSSRIVCTVFMILLIRNRRNAIFINELHKIRLRFSIIKDILKVGVPTGIDLSLFQLGRLLMLNLIATFGTASIAANAVVAQIFGIILIPGGAISMALITVVGQSIGANDNDQVIAYTKRLIRYSYIITAFLCLMAFLFRGSLLSVFNLSLEATELGSSVLIYTIIFTALFHPLSFSMPNALRATGDVNFTMVTSLLSMWLVRIGMSYILEHFFQLGLMSVWIAMYSDWFVRAVVYTFRFASGKWKTKKVV